MLLFGIIRLIFETAASLVAFCFLFRFLMQWAKVGFNNPMAPFISAMTNWLLKPLRRIVPGLGGLDWACIVGVFVVSFAFHAALLALDAIITGKGFGFLATVLVPISIAWVLRIIVYLLMGVVLIYIIMSWVNPQSPMYYLFGQVARPFLEPLRRVVPSIGNVDLSPLVFLLILQIVSMVLSRIVPGF